MTPMLPELWTGLIAEGYALGQQRRHRAVGCKVRDCRLCAARKVKA